MKVLHLPTATGGNAWGLAQGEKRVGLDSRVLVRDDPWHYPCDINLGWRVKNNFARLLSALNTFWQVRNAYDVFHFNFGTTLLDISPYGLPLLDLPFYSADKKLVFTFNGCDARQKFKTMERVAFSACHGSDCYGGMCNSGRRDRFRKRKINKIAKYARHIFALNPDLLWFLPEGSTFLPYTIAQWYEIEPVPYRIDKTITILHAPTDREAKGSSIVIAALERLKKEYGDRLEIVLVENVSNAETVAQCRKADIVVDQVLIGWYGGLAVEAMKMGKPVAVFIREEDLRFVPDGMAAELKEAVINVTPDSVVETLEIYIQEHELLHRKSQAALEYVHRWHDPCRIAKITKEIYES